MSENLLIDQNGSASEAFVTEVNVDSENSANLAEKEVFASDDDIVKTHNIIFSFVKSYSEQKDEIPLDVWLGKELNKYIHLWQDEKEVSETAKEIIETITSYNENKESLTTHRDRGQSDASWLANKIEQGAKVAGATNVTQYAVEIDAVLAQANENSWRVITRQDGLVNMNRNLDGFIAEQHHADTFNIDAATKGSEYRARVLEPKIGQTYGKNSVDIVIENGKGKIVRRYQAKYGEDGESTYDLFEKGDYRGQRKLVPEGHSKDVPNSIETIEVDGVRSKPLSKAQAKERQIKSQRKNEAKQYEWNDTNRIEIAKGIGKQALLAACAATTMQGGRILLRRFWNTLQGKQNPEAIEDMREFLESSLKSGLNVGLVTAISGGVVVAARSGWLGSALKSSPVGVLTSIACVGIENVKVMYRFMKGELMGDEALDAMGRITTITTGNILAGSYGMLKGAALGSVFGPVGSFAGGAIGAVAGTIAGGHFAEKIYDAGKGLVKTATNVAKSCISAVGGTVKYIGQEISNVVSGTWNSINSIFG